MNTTWEHENGAMRLYVDGHASTARIELDGDRWKASLGPITCAWFSSLKDARSAAERSARTQIPLDVLAKL